MPAALPSVLVPSCFGCSHCSTALLHCNAAHCSVLQDAHEFLNYLLNQMAELLEAQNKAAGGNSHAASNGMAPGSNSSSQAGGSSSSPFASYSGSLSAGNCSQPQQQQQQPAATWVHEIFQGKSVSETRCLQVIMCSCASPPQ
jgi:membrane protease subunit (stomatin/prohibitin family)